MPKVKKVIADEVRDTRLTLDGQEDFYYELEHTLPNRSREGGIIFRGSEEQAEAWSKSGTRDESRRVRAIEYRKDVPNLLIRQYGLARRRKQER